MPDSTPAPARGPLDGLLVADFSRILAGPYATMLLADLGAEVIKVESPGGDDTRTWRPPVREGVATYYLAVNRKASQPQQRLCRRRGRPAADGQRASQPVPLRATTCCGR